MVFSHWIFRVCEKNNVCEWLKTKITDVKSYETSLKSRAIGLRVLG